MNPTLYITPTPIGNYEDITLRALRILKHVDFIICEEIKPANRLLSYYNIKKELIPLNEHNEKEVTNNVIEKLLLGKSAAIISDAGTPLFSDPGHYLIELCIKNKIEIIPLPGANSLVPALVSSGLYIEKFYYFGWLSPKKDSRINQLKRLKNIREMIVILETPYRLQKLLNDIALTFGERIYIVLAYKISMPEEKIFRGTVSSIFKIVEKENLKGEFVLILDNRK